MARTYRTTFKCTGTNSRLIQPSIHYQTDVPLGGDEPDPSDVASAIWSHLASGFTNITPNSVTIHELVVLEEVVKPDIGVAGSHTIESAGSLSGSAPYLPDGLVGIVNMHTDTRSRSARGWWHTPSPGFASYVNENSWQGTWPGLVNTLCALLDDQLELGTLQITKLNPVVYSPTRHKQGLDPYTFRVKSATLNPVPHWLRPRMSAP